MQGFIIVGTVLSSFYIICLGLLVKRRGSAYILRRTPAMLIVSLIGNWAQCMMLLSILCEVEKSLNKDRSKDCEMFFRVRQSWNLISHYLLFTPYLLRAYRIAVIFRIDQEWETNESNIETYIYKTKEKWMVAFLLVFSLPIILMCIIILNNCTFAWYMPGAESIRQKEVSESISLFISFFEQLLLMWVTFKLKDISDDYAMTTELTVVMATWFISPTFMVFPLVDLKHLQAIPILIRNLLLFVVSSVYPVICSFYIHSNDHVVTSEMIESIESVLQSKVPLEQFDKYLRSFENKGKDSKFNLTGSELLELYMKCEMYLNSPKDMDMNEMIRDLLKTEVVPLNYVRDSKETLEFQINRAKGVILNILKKEFFPGFKESSRFGLLKRYVHCQEIYTGRLIKIGLTDTYSSLIKSSMSFED
jgi:hypothetical protein